MRRSIAAIVLALLVCGGFTATPANATYEGSDTCPLSNNGDGGVLTDAVTNILLNDSTTVVVKVEGAQDVRVVCTSFPEQGKATVNGNGTIYYKSFDGPKAVDSFVVGATDGDKYFSTTVTVNLERTVFKTPVVTRKMVVRNNKPISRGRLTITNTTTRLMYVKVGATPNRPDVIKEITGGARATVGTWRKTLVVTMFTTNSDGYDVYVTSAIANMVTGTVSRYQDRAFGIRY